jgi:hypothetical protein
MFAAGRYLERAEAGEFGCCLKRDSTPATTHQPTGTRSVLVSYRDGNDHQVFVVHFYLHPPRPGDPAPIGGSGKPDPKWLYEDGVVFRPARLDVS